MIAKATTNLYPQVVNWDEKYGSFDKDGNKVEIDESKIAEEVKRLQAEYEATQYQRDRASAYPSYADQLDTIYHKGLDAWKALVKETKDKYPKP